MEKNFISDIHKWGKIWGIIAAIAIMSFPFILMILYQTLPDWNGLLKGLLAVGPMFWAVGAIEVITYIPMIGSGASYLAFVTGNITNLKAPVALTALENANLVAGSEEGEIVSTISVAVSSIVTTLIVALGVLVIAIYKPIGEFLASEALKPMFDNILPALFGGLAVVYVSKYYKIAIAPIILMLVLFIFVPALNSGTVGIMVPVGALVTILVARVLYKKGYLTKTKETLNEEKEQIK